MHINDRQDSLAPAQKSRFPFAEGVGIFVGIVAWDLLSDGYIEISKALLVAIPSTLVWFAIRCWKDRSNKK